MKDDLRNALLRAAKERLLFAVIALAVIFAIGLLGHRADAKILNYGSGLVIAPIKPLEPTVCRFPKPVQSVQGASGRFEIGPQNPNDPTYTSLSVKPKVGSGSYPISFYLNDGTVVQAKFEVTASAPESFYDFQPMGSVGQDSLGSSDEGPSMSQVDLLRAMVLGASPSGYKITNPNADQGSKAGARIELLRVYRGSPFNGYVFRVTNTNWKKDVEIDVRNITVGEPNQAILAQSDEAILKPKGKGTSQTLLRIVAKDTSASRDVILAMESSAPPSDSNKEAKSEHQ